MKTNKTWLAMLAAVAALIAVQTIGAQSRYTVTDLGTLPGLENSYVWQQTLNNRGHVAAYANNEADPNALFGASPYLWKGPGDYDLLPGFPDFNVATGLNNRDQVVGMSGPDPDGKFCAVLWERGMLHNLGTLPGDSGSEAFLINNAGMVVGDSYSWNGEILSMSAVYWNHGKIFPLPPLNDGTVSVAYGVNDRGRIVGQSGDWEHSHAVLWTIFPEPSVIDLDTLGVIVPRPTPSTTAARLLVMRRPPAATGTRRCGTRAVSRIWGILGMIRSVAPGRSTIAGKSLAFPEWTTSTSARRTRCCGRMAP